MELEIADFLRIEQIINKAVMISKSDPMLSRDVSQSRMMQLIYTYGLIGHELHLERLKFDRNTTVGEKILDLIFINYIYNENNPILRETMAPKNEILNDIHTSFHDLLQRKTLFSARYEILSNIEGERNAASMFLTHEIIHEIFSEDFNIDGDISIVKIMTFIYPTSTLWNSFARLLESRFVRCNVKIRSDMNYSKFCANKKTYLGLLDDIKKNGFD